MINYRLRTTTPSLLSGFSLISLFDNTIHKSSYFRLTHGKIHNGIRTPSGPYYSAS